MGRLEILKNSLKKKQEALEKKFQAHFEDVKSANGQPLNDKRNGPSTMRRWGRQSDSIRALKVSIQKTEKAIERENFKIFAVEDAAEYLPRCLLDRAERGELNQWRRHPNYFFVPGVEKARILYDEKKKRVFYKFDESIPTQEQRDKFFAVLKEIKKDFENEANQLHS